MRNTYLTYMQEHADEFINIRRDIHQHPELGYKEFRTSSLVGELLEKWGYDVYTGYAETGLVAVLKRGSGTKSIGIRADMDALPLQELTDLPYASTIENTMHACGHDGHTTMLLGAAKYLSEKGQFSGTLNLIFQPAEEGLAGARQMMQDGLFEKHPCDAVFALHNLPGFEQGTLLFRSGPTMSASDYVSVTLTGEGGHGAYPHLTKDPVVAASAIVMALQSVVARNVIPGQVAVVTVGSLHAGHTNNVIPRQATLELSIRCQDPEIRTLLEVRVRELIDLQAKSFGVTADVEFTRGYPALFNSEAETQFARDVALSFAGPEKVVTNTHARLGSEDFAYMLEEVPGCYLFIGNGAGDDPGARAVHNPYYDFNDKNIIVGASYWACLAESYLNET